VGFVVGDFNPSEIKPVIQSYFSRLKPGREAPPPVVTLEHKPVAEMRMNAEVEAQPSVEIRWHTVPFRHKDSYALEILASILNGRTGRLYKTMIEGTEIASNAGAQSETRKYAGAFSIGAETKGSATPAQLEAAIDAEVLTLQNELVSAQELQKVKNQNAANQYRRLQNNMFLMVQLAVAEAMGGWQEINEQAAKLDAVTAEDIQRVAKQYLTKNNRAVATYVRKAASATTADAGPDDAEIAKLPPQMQAGIRDMVKRLAQEQDAEKIRAALAQMDSQVESVPEPMKVAFEFMRRKMAERLEQLEKK
jgi:predicted Zn-dependent peptidase